MRRVSILTGILWAMMMAGCLPIELDVSRDGQVLVPRQEGFFVLDSASGKVTRVHQPTAGQPVFARFVPGNKHILAVSQTGTGGGSQTFELASLTEPAVKKLHTATNASYVTVSPDGKTAAFARISDQAAELRDGGSQNLPELHVIDLEKGEHKSLAKPVGPIASIHRWFPDSKSLLLFQITGKIENSNLRKGELSRVDLAGLQATTLAVAIGGDNVFFDLSPDGKKVLFTAVAAGKRGAELKADGDTSHLFELTVETGDVRQINRQASFALWSPDGSKALIAGKAENGIVKLEVANAALTEFVTVAEDAAASAGSAGNEVSIYPAWLDNSRIGYLAMRAVYGAAGKNLELVFVGADGKGRVSQQTRLDEAAAAGK